MKCLGMYMLYDLQRETQESFILNINCKCIYRNHKQGSFKEFTDRSLYTKFLNTIITFLVNIASTNIISYVLAICYV